MKLTQTLFFLLFVNFGFAQNSEKITIPKRVVYNYANDKTNQKAKELIEESLSQKDNFKLLGENLIVGPTLWKKFQNIETLKNIPGNVIFHIDNLEVDGKNCQTLEESKKVWIEVKKEINEKYIIRKANEDELDYYWSTISFDIEEPLFIIETDQHKYILNFIEKNLKLFWIDEFPNKKTYENPIDKNVYKTDGEFKTYQNGEEVYLTSKGEKETKLEKVIFLSSDSELKKNTSIEDIKNVIDRTNAIFEKLFIGSEKAGKIMIQFELGKKKNEIQFAVRDDLDLDIMKEFEKQVNSEKYPNARKSTVKFQLIYKVNSLNDTE
jgi:hypothetical protein